MKETLGGMLTGPRTRICVGPHLNSEMPILDMIWFTFPEGRPKECPALQNFLEMCKAYEGVISAWHGFQIEDATQFHIVVVWHSYLHLTTASKDSYYPNLPPITDSALQRKLFDINEYPEAALAAPITDMTFMFLKDGYAFEKDVKPLLIRFTELGDDTGAIGTYWGEATESEGMSIVVIGWDSVQQHYDCGKQPAYKELNDSAVPVVNFDLKHVEFEQSF